jgi:hypothetical protein
MPRDIAQYLNLPDANLYTGHAFRRTSATLLADSGADITTLKRHGGWRSSNVAEGYIENSIDNKLKIGKQIAKSINVKSQESTEFSSSTFQSGLNVPVNTEPQPGPSHANNTLVTPSPFNQPGPSRANNTWITHSPSNFDPQELSQQQEPENTPCLTSQTLNLHGRNHNITMNCTNCTINYNYY